MAAAAGAGVAAATQEDMQRVFDRLVLMDLTMKEFKEEIESQNSQNASYHDLTTQTLSQKIDEFNVAKDKSEDESGKRFAASENVMVQLISEATKEFIEIKAATEKVKIEVDELFSKCDVLFKGQTSELKGLTNEAQVAFTKITFDIEQSQRAHAELYSRTEISFIEFEKKLNNIEGVKSVEKFAEIKAFADSIHAIMTKNQDVTNDRLGKLEGGEFAGARGEGKPWEPKPTIFIKAKEQIPDKMDEDVTKWREWKDSFLSYADTLRPGMKSWLNKVESLTSAPKEEIIDDKATWKELDRESLWRGIKACTTGEARKIIDSTEAECGYEAWFDLCKNFEPAMQAKKGAALADLYLM